MHIRHQSLHLRPFMENCTHCLLLVIYIVAAAVNDGLSSATVAAITAPIVLLLMAALASLFFFYRLRRRPRSLHRNPSGIYCLEEHTNDGTRNFCLNYQQNDG